MSDLRPQIRTVIQQFLSTQVGYHQPVDVLRVLEEEAMLWKETETIRDMLDVDPMEQLGGIKKGTMDSFKAMFRVTDCSRVRTGHDYCGIDATVTFDGTDPSKKENLQLTFRYERKRPDDGDQERVGCHVRYSIQMSKGYQQKDNLLVVQVWAPKTVPSAGTAICINQKMHDDENDDDDEDGWEDIDDEDEIPDHPQDANQSTPSATKPPLIENYASTTTTIVVSDDGQSGGQTTNHPNQDIGTKRRKVEAHSLQECDCENRNQPVVSKNQLNKQSKGWQSRQEEKDDDDDDEGSSTNDKVDLYSAFLDGDLLHDFLDFTGLEPMDEDKAFFLLMTFPFYEHEWDLVGYVLDEVFGMEEEVEEGGNDHEQ